MRIDFSNDGEKTQHSRPLFAFKMEEYRFYDKRKENRCQAAMASNAGSCPAPGGASVPFENVPGEDLVLNIVQAGIISVGDDAVGESFELCQVIDDPAAKEGLAIGQCGLVDDNGSAFGFDALHDTFWGRAFQRRR